MADLAEGFVTVDKRITDKPVTFKELSVREFNDACRRARGVSGVIDGQELSVYIAYYSMRTADGALAIESLDAFLDLPWNAVRPVTDMATKANQPTKDDAGNS